MTGLPVLYTFVAGFIHTKTIWSLANIIATGGAQTLRAACIYVRCIAIITLLGSFYHIVSTNRGGCTCASEITVTGGSILRSFITRFIQSLPVWSLTNAIATRCALAGCVASICIRKVSIITLFGSLQHSIPTHRCRSSRTGQIATAGLSIQCSFITRFIQSLPVWSLTNAIATRCALTHIGTGIGI